MHREDIVQKRLGRKRSEADGSRRSEKERYKHKEPHSTYGRVLVDGVPLDDELFAVVGVDVDVVVVVVVVVDVADVVAVIAHYTTARYSLSLPFT